MFKQAHPVFLLCETPLHAGSGTDLGIIDLPIQRERHTGFPKVEASGLKGCFRDAFEQLSRLEVGGQTVTGDEKSTVVNLMFGPDRGSEHAAALGFTDARILLFPVKSAKGVFAWITCPNVLARFLHDLKLSGKAPDLQVPDPNAAARGSRLFVKDNDNRIVLEEFTFKINYQEDERLSRIADWLSRHAVPDGPEYDYIRDKIRTDIVLLGDDDFRDFVQLSTEVVTRIRVDNEKGTVRKGALFTEEYLPSETVLYALALASPVFGEQVGDARKEEQGETKKRYFERHEQDVINAFLANHPKVIQLGGNATIGKGIVRVVCPA